MNTLSFLSVYILPAVAVFALLSALFLRNKEGKQQAHRIAQIETLVEGLSQELIGMTHAANGVGRKVQRLEFQSNKLTSTLDDLKKNAPSQVSYTEATRLVNLGASLEDLMNTCGISRPEAELVLAMTKKAQKQEDVPVLQAQSFRT
jgi:hypothetical protein